MIVRRKRKRLASLCARLLFPAVAVLCTQLARAQSTKTTAVVSLDNAVPSGADVDDIVLTSDLRHSYYITMAGDVFHYDRQLKTNTRLAGGGPWDLAIAANGSAIAYAKSGENIKDEFIWTIPLDPASGAAKGPERRVSVMSGDTPAISNDGRQLAFAKDFDDRPGQAIVVLPLAGGPERVIVPDSPTGVDMIRWSADSKSIYFTNTAARGSHRSFVIQRVSASGGTPQIVVASTPDAWPGPSPSGRFIVYRDSASDRIVVADGSGKPLTNTNVPAGRGIGGWAGDKLILETSTRPRRVAVYSLADRKSRVLIDGLRGLTEVAVSPDGKRIAFTNAFRSNSELVVMNMDGTSRRTYHAREEAAPGLWWSPDGAWIAYRGGRSATDPTSLNLIELSSGREVRAASSMIGSPRWEADSRHILVTDGPVPVRPTLGPRRLAVREVALDGSARTIREVDTRGYGYAVSIDAVRTIVRGETEGVSVVGSNPSALLPANSGFISIPSFSGDGDWIAFRRNTISNDNRHYNVLDVMRLDGSQRTTIKLTSPSSVGDGYPQFFPGSHDVVIADSGFAYRMTLPGGAREKLFPIHTNKTRIQHYSLTPDGRSIAYITIEAAPIAVSTIDVANAAGGAKAPK